MGHIGTDTGPGPTVPAPLRIFLSHTGELAEEPAVGASFIDAAMKAVTDCHQVPVEMASFVAQETDPARVCQEEVSRCDVYVGIIGFRYGSPVRNRPELSYTELEFETATELGKERLIFLLDERRTVGTRALFFDPLYERQERFRARLLASDIIVERVASPADLEHRLYRALTDLLRRREEKARKVPLQLARPVSRFPPPVLAEPPVPRPALVERLAGVLTAASGPPVAITGGGGFGKTTLVVMSLGQARVRAVFPTEKVVWVDVGQNRTAARLADLINNVAAGLGATGPAPSDPLQAGQRLGDLLVGSQTLLVVDDVWTVDQLRPFEAAAHGCRLLVTTRDANVLPLHAVPVDVDVMEPGQAEQLLTGAVPGLGAARARRLAARCGHWPVLLRLVAGHLKALLRDGAPADAAVSEVCLGLDEAGPAAFDDPTTRARAVAVTVEASLRHLQGFGDPSGDALARYLELGVFPSGTVIPQDLLALLWGRTAGWSRWQTVRFCRRLTELSLVRSDPGGQGGLRLHDVMHDYVRMRLGERLPEVHAELLAARAGKLPTEDGRPAWWQLPPEEGYLWENLPLHLRGAGDHAALATLVRDLRWAAAKTCAIGPVSVEADAALLPADPAARSIGRLIRQTANLLQRGDPLPTTVATLAAYAAGVEALAASAEAAFAWLRPAALRPVAPPLPDQPDPALMQTLTAPVGKALTVAPDGSWLASGGGGIRRGGGEGAIRIWHPDSGAGRVLLTGDNGGVSALATGRDSTWLASGSDDGTIRIWDVGTGQTRHVLAGHTERVSVLVLAPDGRWLASGGGDGTIRVWDPATGGARMTLAGDNRWVSALAVAPDGSWLASGGGDGTVRLWDTADWTTLTTWPGHTGWVSALVAAPDGSWLASGGWDGAVRLWDPRRGEARGQLTVHDGNVEALVAAPDGTWLASAGTDGTVRLADPAARAARALVTGHAMHAYALTTAPDGAWLVSSGGDGTVRIWNPRAAGTELPRTVSRIRAVCRLAGPPGDDWLAIGSADGTIQLWDPAEARALDSLASADSPVSILVAAPDGGWLGYADDDGSAWVWDQRTALSTRLTCSGRPSRVLAMVAAPDSSWLATGQADATVRVFARERGLERRVLTGHDKGVLALAVPADGSWLASAGSDGTVLVWDPPGEEATDRDGRSYRVALEGHTSPVRVLAAAPDGSWLASAGLDGTVRVWDPRAGTGLAVLGGDLDEVSVLAAAPDGSWLAAAGRDETVWIWGPRTGAARAELAGHTDGVRALAVSRDGARIASVGRDQAVRVWTPDGERVAMVRLDGSLRDCHWCGPDRLAVGGARGVYLFRLG